MGDPFSSFNYSAGHVYSIEDTLRVNIEPCQFWKGYPISFSWCVSNYSKCDSETSNETLHEESKRLEATS